MLGNSITYVLEKYKKILLTGPFKATECMLMRMYTHARARTHTHTHTHTHTDFSYGVKYVF